MKSHQLLPRDYFQQMATIYERLPSKNAEKQAMATQHELTLGLLADTPYLPFYLTFMRLNDLYGPNGNFTENYCGNVAFVRCRYMDIFTRRQKEFSHDYPMDALAQDLKHRPGVLPAGLYPAAKIYWDEKTPAEFVVLGEGPYLHTFRTLMDRLAEQQVNVLVAVGPTEENGREKYFNYMAGGTAISAAEYLRCTTTLKDIPPAFYSQEGISLKFYRYVQEDMNRTFYIMHIPSWKDLGLPRFTAKDKHVLMYDMEYGKNRFYHCSAGVGRSVAMIMMRMIYEYVCKPQLQLEAAVATFTTILEKIKHVKPRAGEWWQLVLAVGMAEEMHALLLQHLAEKNAVPVKNESLLVARSLFNQGSSNVFERSSPSMARRNSC